MHLSNRVYPILWVANKIRSRAYAKCIPQIPFLRTIRTSFSRDQQKYFSEQCRPNQGCRYVSPCSRHGWPSIITDLLEKHACFEEQIYVVWRWQPNYPVVWSRSDWQSFCHIHVTVLCISDMPFMVEYRFCRIDQDKCGLHMAYLPRSFVIFVRRKNGEI